MSQKRLYRDTFHKELKAFMKNLVGVFPDDREMKMFSSTLNIAVMDDPEDDVLRVFYQSLLPFEEMIDKRDPAFFVETQKIPIVEDVQLFSKLGSYWDCLHEDNRKTVWDYLQVLFLLSKSFFH